MGFHKELNKSEFIEQIGVDDDQYIQNLQSEFDDIKFLYKNLDDAEYQQVIIEILRTIYEKELPKSGERRQLDWEKGWAENLFEFSSENFDTSKLMPKYVQNGRPIRLNNKFVNPVSLDFEWNLSVLYRKALFHHYFKKCYKVHEFGCGTGTNLLLMSEILPGIKLHGYDWAESSVSIVNLLSDKKGLNVVGHQFDFFQSDDCIQMGEDDGVLTFHALEQVGSDFKPFVNMIIKKLPKIVVSVECIKELYETQNLNDFLAIKYHEKRNYLDGYLNYLRELEVNGLVNILDVKRMYIGNLFHEAYSQVIWEPGKMLIDQVGATAFLTNFHAKQ